MELQQSREGKKHVQKAHAADLAKLKTIESKLYAKPGMAASAIADLETRVKETRALTHALAMSAVPMNGVPALLREASLI